MPAQPRLAATVLAVVATLALPTAAAAAASPAPAARPAAAPAAGPATRPATQPAAVGKAGAGDPYFPLQGNTGYDARHYAIRLRYFPRRDQLLIGHVQLSAVTTQRLSRFDLDLRPDMRARVVRVDGVIARFRQTSHELVITPAAVLRRGAPMRVSVSYAGHAHYILDPDGSLDGWIPTDDGAFVADEPQGAPTWFPVNDTPDDKASYTTTVTVPRGLAAIGNGGLVAHHVAHGRSTWSWRESEPISSYLVTATVGHFRIYRGHVTKRIPYLVAIDPRESKATRLVLRELPRIVRFYSSKYGRYPFGEAGAIVDHAPRVGYALETATRPLFDRAPSDSTLAHELAHQWYGDTVTCRRWHDIWINEGFAEFSSWLWESHNGGRGLRADLRRLLSLPADNPIWSPPPGNPGKAKDIFAGSVYERGAGTLEALRERLGDTAFFRIMRGWLSSHRYGTGTSRGFVRYASTHTTRDVAPLLNRWLFRPGKP